MDVRLEVLRISGVWSVTQSGPGLLSFASVEAALSAAISAARRHHDKEGGRATVHLWDGSRETEMFDTAMPAAKSPLMANEQRKAEL
jgi:hypothetical protein